MFSVGMIGAGIIGAKHVNAVSSHEQTRLTAVADIDLGRAKQAAQGCLAKAYDSYEQMLQCEKLDIAIINLPHGLHEESVIACAKKGLHILLEKPMSISYDSCLRMKKACDEAGVLLQIGHVQRFIAQNRAAYDLIQSGKLGKLAMISDLRTNNYFTQNRPRWFLNKAMAGGGISMNYAAHSLDKICYLTKSKIAEIKGNCTYFEKDADVDGSAQIYLKTESGISAVISLCGYAVMPVDETMLFFEHGAIRLHTGTDVAVTYGAEYKFLDTSYYPDAFEAQWAEFIDSIKEKHILGCDSTYGAEIVRSIELLYQ